MSTPLPPPERWVYTDAEKIHGILRRAVRGALWRHKQLGQSVAVSKDGKVVILKPEEIPVDGPEE